MYPFQFTLGNMMVSVNPYEMRSQRWNMPASWSILWRSHRRRSIDTAYHSSHNSWGDSSFLFRTPSDREWSPLKGHTLTCSLPETAQKTISTKFCFLKGRYVMPPITFPLFLMTRFLWRLLEHHAWGSRWSERERHTHRILDERCTLVASSVVGWRWPSSVLWDSEDWRLYCRCR